MNTWKTSRVAALVLLAALAQGCATTRTTTTTRWIDPSTPGTWARPGRVGWVREIVTKEQGHPVGGAVAGAMLGGFLFGGRGPRALVGSAAGAAVGAAASQGSSESRSFEMLVRFDDGTEGMFVYSGVPPFGPGERVVLTPEGLARAATPAGNAPR